MKIGLSVSLCNINKCYLKFRELEVPGTWELEVPGTWELEVPGTWELRNLKFRELRNLGTSELTLGCPLYQCIVSVCLSFLMSYQCIVLAVCPKLRWAKNPAKKISHKF